MPYTRRDILKLAALVGLSPWLPACASNDPNEPTIKPTTTSNSPVPSDSTPQVIVIGAGIAGLAAAAKLQANGYRVQIIEGRDRIGGRIWTSRMWDDMPVDLGASWIHGVTHNPLTDLADTAGIERTPTDYENSLAYTMDGEELDDAAVEQLEEQLVTLMDAVAELVEDTDDMSLAAAMQQVLAEQAESLDQPHLNFSINSTIEHEYAADVEELSAQYWDNDGEVVGGDVIFLDGYDQILDRLTAGLTIHTGQSVNAINYTAESITITTDTATFAAEHVIITVPLGVLKQGRIQFIPPLDASKTDAITLLGSGLLNKTWLRFPTAFWPQEPEIINYIDEQKGRWAEFLNIYHYTNSPILLGFNAGSYARMLESRSDAEIIADGMQVLRTIYGPTIPDPEAWQITRWGADPYALGSYSFLGIGATDALRDDLTQPVGGRLFFAGEATSRDYPSTVHGAYLSGLRAADEVMQA
ncbi:FAD-dependent oxidoreductase [Herpetosiphon gulosus]|uniref:Pseudooxynicotine oxidase n=1 Tax=Herpetosiphon gulosus TaxID=1973496 RepID=A0ABP9WV60_9CHLR